MMTRQVREIVTLDDVKNSRQSNGHLHGLVAALEREQLICQTGKIVRIEIVLEVPDK